MDTRSGPKPQRIGLIRLRSKPGEGKEFRPIVQRFCWWRIILFQSPWVDWFPAVNAVRALQHEFIECVERMDLIVNHELPDAQAYLEACYEKLANGNKETGLTLPEPAVITSSREGEMPNVEKRFKQLEKLFPKDRVHAMRPTGHRTLYWIGEGRIDTDLFKREELGATFKDILKFHIPAVFNQKPVDPQQQGGKGNQQRQKDPEFSWLVPDKRK